MPLRRKTLDDLIEAKSRILQLVELAGRLAQCRDKDRVLARSPGSRRPSTNPREPIRDGTFIPKADSSDEAAARDAPRAMDEEHHRYVCERIQKFCRASPECDKTAHSVHEAEWDDSPLARIGSGPLRRPLTPRGHSAITISPMPAWTNAFRTRLYFLRRTVDYSILLASDSYSKLRPRIASHQQMQPRRGQANPQMHSLYVYEPDGPLAVSVETNLKRGSDAQEPSQLAN
ncbi:hypothetical protein DL771_006187 [Monosporascus sp. 5C6A]|nr:hypothetical protein DL771_006187 [Monosporascus sp. 5C6A]